MDYIPSKNIHSKLNFLAAYQIAGGLIGIGITSLIFFKITVYSILIIAIIIAVIALYSFSIYAGILLLKRKLISLNYSSIIQLLQLISFKIAGFGFTYVSGIYITAGIDLTHSFNFRFGMGVSTWDVAIGSSSELFIIYFNFAALAMIIFIDKIKKQIAQEKANDLVEQIAG
jgi:hypothetical protein